ncbi:uncharacterized protein LOC117582909 [Drosophila guanche]|uniref:Uncharacterized protein n=1 Tax=Drosophila guanche TaxID=7266 RepID=A0A3B0JYM6_DROGU|nr:uncharacterized protein LOC117582909 [Drosophila guanche]SPP80620.1 Hypothetical predicted protein [Drosophila guanche]
MSQKQSKPLKVNKISVLRKMIGLDKKKTAKDCIVPNNSAQNIQKPGLYDPTSNATDPMLSGIMTHNCPYCENLAKNFLYLESLIRNNTESAHKCSVCHASLKYLEHVNRNVRQVFGNSESLVKADRALNTTPPMLPKYSVTPMAQRASGGAVLSPQKSLKTLKKSKSKTKSAKVQKSAKSLKSLKSLKTIKTAGKALSKALKSSKSGKSLGKSKQQLKTGSTIQTGRGKMVLKRKYRKAAIKAPGLAAGRFKIAASRSKMAASRSKMSASRSKTAASHSKLGHKGASKQKLPKKRSEAVPMSINWKLLKKNLPKRIPLSTQC